MLMILIFIYNLKFSIYFSKMNKNSFHKSLSHYLFYFKKVISIFIDFYCLYSSHYNNTFIKLLNITQFII